VLNNTFDFPCFVDETQRGVTHGSYFLPGNVPLSSSIDMWAVRKGCLEMGASVILFFAILMEGKSLLLAY